MDCKEIEELIPAYVLDALSPEEALRVEGHLDRCPWCSLLVREQQEVASGLALGVELSRPPSQLIHRLMRRVEGLSGDQRDRRRPVPAFRVLAFVATVISILLLGGVLALTIRTSGQVDDLRDTNRTLTQQMTKLQEDNVFLSQGLVQQVSELSRGNSATVEQLLWLTESGEESLGLLRMQRFMIYMLTLPSTQVVHLAGARTTAQGILMFNPQNNTSVFVATGLEVLPANQTYQIWLRKGEEQFDGGPLSVDDTGWGMAVLETEDVMEAYESVGVTVEPVSGGPAPTGDSLMSGNVALANPTK